MLLEAAGCATGFGGGSARCTTTQTFVNETRRFWRAAAELPLSVPKLASAAIPGKALKGRDKVARGQAVRPQPRVPVFPARAPTGRDKLPNRATVSPFQGSYPGGVSQGCTSAAPGVCPGLLCLAPLGLIGAMLSGCVSPRWGSSALCSAAVSRHAGAQRRHAQRLCLATLGLSGVMLSGCVSPRWGSSALCLGRSAEFPSGSDGRTLRIMRAWSTIACHNWNARTRNRLPCNSACSWTTASGSSWMS